MLTGLLVMLLAVLAGCVYVLNHPDESLQAARKEWMMLKVGIAIVVCRYRQHVIGIGIILIMAGVTLIVIR